MEGRVDDARRRAIQSPALDPDSTTALRTLLKVTRSVPGLITLSGRLLASNPDDDLTRSWLEVLRHSHAPEVNYLAPVEGKVVVICERESDGRLFTRAHAHPLKDLCFLADTGASGLVLSENRARQMGMRLREFSWSAGVGETRRHSHPILLPRLIMGGLRGWEILATASVLPDGIDGIINPLIFTPAGSGLTLGLRAEESSLVITKQRLFQASIGRRHPGGWITAPILAEGHRAIFRVVLAGAPVMALLDTGAAANIVDRTVLLRVPGTSMSEGPAGSGMLIGFGGPMEGAEVTGQIPLRIADVLPDRPVSLSTRFSGGPCKRCCRLDDRNQSFRDETMTDQARMTLIRQVDGEPGKLSQQRIPVEPPIIRDLGGEAGVRRHPINRLFQQRLGIKKRCGGSRGRGPHRGSHLPGHTVGHEDGIDAAFEGDTRHFDQVFIAAVRPDIQNPLPARIPVPPDGKTTHAGGKPGCVNLVGAALVERLPQRAAPAEIASVGRLE